MRTDPKPQEMYRYFKGNIYQIRCLAKHSETGEMMVVYQAMYDTFQIYVRPLDMFMEEVDHVKYPDVKQKYRFELLQDMEMTSSVQSQSYDLEKDLMQLQIHMQDGKTVQPQTHVQEELADQQQIRAQEDLLAQPQTHAQADAATQLQTTCIQTEESDEQVHIDPLVMEFLDADTYEQRLNILAALRHRITDDMINTMAVAVDLEIKDGNIEERYEELKNCLLTFERYECNRLR